VKKATAHSALRRVKLLPLTKWLIPWKVEFEAKKTKSDGVGSQFCFWYKTRIATEVTISEEGIRNNPQNNHKFLIELCVTKRRDCHDFFKIISFYLRFGSVLRCLARVMQPLYENYFGVLSLIDKRDDASLNMAKSLKAHLVISQDRQTFLKFSQRRSIFISFSGYYAPAPRDQLLASRSIVLHSGAWLREHCSD